MKSVVEYVKEKTLEYESQTKVQQIQSMLTGKFQVCQDQGDLEEERGQEEGRQEEGYEKGGRKKAGGGMKEEGNQERNKTSMRESNRGRNTRKTSDEKALSGC